MPQCHSATVPQYFVLYILVYYSTVKTSVFANRDLSLQYCTGVKDLQFEVLYSTWWTPKPTQIKLSPSQALSSSLSSKIDPIFGVHQVLKRETLRVLSCFVSRVREAF